MMMGDWRTYIHFFSQRKPFSGASIPTASLTTEEMWPPSIYLSIRVLNARGVVLLYSERGALGGVSPLLIIM